MRKEQSKDQQNTDARSWACTGLTVPETMKW